jgi:hypothetical protein
MNLNIFRPFPTQPNIKYRWRGPSKHSNRAAVNTFTGIQKSREIAAFFFIPGYSLISQKPKLKPAKNIREKFITQV